MEVLCKDATLGFYNEFGIYNIPIGQYDIGRIISVTFMNEGSIFQIPDDTLVFFKAIKPDGNQIDTDKYCYINKKMNTVEICVFNQLSITSGVVNCEIILANSQGQKYTSSHFNIVVIGSVSNDEHLKSTDEYHDIVEILIEIEGLKKDLIFKSDKDIAGGIPSLDENSKVPREELYEADLNNKGIVKLVDSTTSNSTTDAVTPNSVRIVNEALQTHKNNKDNPHGMNDIVTQAVSEHNTSNTSHADIRELITVLTTKLNTLADSDDETLDQLSEIVSYIKNNKGLIDSVTTNKVNVSDIVDNLTSTDNNKPLSANQGKLLHELIADLENSISGGISNYTDEDKEIVDSFKNLTVEDAKSILNGTYII